MAQHPLPKFLKAFVPATIALIAILAPIYIAERKDVIDDLCIREENQVEQGALILANYFDLIAADVVGLTATHDLEDFALLRRGQGNVLGRHHHSYDAQAIEDDWYGYLRQKRTYDRLYLFDLQGNIDLSIALDQNPSSRLSNDISNDSAALELRRLYWPVIRQLKRNQVFISPLEIGTTSHQPKSAPTPTVYLAAPVYGHDQELAGFLVVRHDTGRLLHVLTTVCPSVYGSCLVVNDQGEGLLGEHTTRGGDQRYSAQQHPTVNDQFPELWQQIQTRTAGSFVSENGLFAFRLALPLQDNHRLVSPSDGAAASAGEYRLWVISHIPNSVLAQELKPIDRRFLFLFIVLWLTVGIAIVIVTNDRYRRLLLHQRLQASEERFRGVSEMAPVGIFTANAAGQLTYANKALLEMLKMDPAQQTELPWERLLHPADRPAVLATWREAVERQQPFYHRFRLLYEDGQIRWLNARATPIFEDNVLTGFVGTWEDISQMMTQQELLEAARNAAEDANRAKSEFLATMSHEIRTPMNAIIGLTGLLLDTPLNPQQKEFLNTIRLSGDALLAIINDILDFSKIESGKLELEAYPFNLRTCVEDVLELMASRALERKVELIAHIDPAVPVHVIGDMGRLRQILVNLLSNGVKFTEQGNLVLYVKSFGQSQQGDRHEFLFAVQDTGVGIPPHGVQRLFKPFSQVDASITRHYGGTGLGLAICQRLVERMEGRIWVESKSQQSELVIAGDPPPHYESIPIPETGSVFYFTVKLLLNPNAARITSEESLPLRNRHVLIVDDNSTNREILALQTQNWQMIPILAESGAAALALLATKPLLDVAILDLQMPGMDGVTLARQIRNTYPHLPMILLTSLGNSLSAQETRLFRTLISKPVKQSTLYNVLNDLFSNYPTISTVKPRQSSTEALTVGLPPLRILVAEDNKVNQMVALRMLQKLGYRGDIAANGLEVLEAVQRQPYDVILMDMQMPEMDGVTATREVIRLFQTLAQPRPRIIAMTANAMESDRQLCLEAGMDDYLSKPISLEELVRALRECSPLSPGTPSA